MREGPTIVEHCRQALAGDLPDAVRAEVLNVLGLCLYNMGFWDEGVRRCVEAIGLDRHLAHEHEVLR